MSQHAHYFHPDLAHHLCQDFFRNGFLHYPGFLQPQDLTRLREQVISRTAKQAATLPDEGRWTQRGGGYALDDLHYYDLFFEDLLSDSRFEQLAGLLLRDRVQGETLGYVYHPPQSPAGFAPRQDGATLMIAPWNALTIWVALENMDQDTGCLHYYKGSHLEGMYEHTEGPTGSCLTEPQSVGMGKSAVAFPIKAGDLLVHHCLTAHWLSHNHSYTRSLRALRLCYIAERAIVRDSVMIA
ncbi:MAG: hypothetical protein D6722_09505 [Bacteroidetes bacterium]|nr:MAG: hypothetical protein D6722_09505 [Bacteroidota bacterium]